MVKRDRKDWLLKALEEQRNEIANQFAQFAATANLKIAELEAKLNERTQP